MTGSVEYRYILLSLFLVSLFTVLGAVLHFLRGAIGANEQFWGKGSLLKDLMHGNFFEIHVLKLNYNEYGAWELYSLRNLVYMVFCANVIPAIYIFNYWDRKSQFVTGFCKSVGPLRTTILGCA